MSLVRLASYDEMFRRSPVGHYATGDQFLVWCASRMLCGMVVWGQPSVSDLRRVLEVFDHTEATGIAIPCDFVLDIRRLDRVDMSLFSELGREVSVRWSVPYRPRVRRQCGPGLGEKAVQR